MRALIYTYIYACHACMHECIPTEDISLYRPVKTRDVCRHVSCMHMCVCVCAPSFVALGEIGRI